MTQDKDKKYWNDEEISGVPNGCSYFRPVSRAEVFDRPPYQEYPEPEKKNVL